MTCFHTQYYVFAPSEEFVQNLKAVSPGLELSTDTQSFRLVSSVISKDLPFLPRTSVHGVVETTESGILVKTRRLNTFNRLDVLCCLIIFALWVAQRAWTWQNHIDGILIPSWWLKTLIFGPALIYSIFIYCRIRIQQKALLIGAVREAAALTASVDLYKSK